MDSKQALSTHHLIILGCSHWFSESWPPGIQIDPDTPRICSYPEHRGRRYAALYLPLPVELPDGLRKYEPHPAQVACAKCGVLLDKGKLPPEVAALGYYNVLCRPCLDVIALGIGAKINER